MSIARHTAYNLIGAAVPLGVSLITVPLYLKAIGLDRYGVLSICWLLVGYFSLFDFGLGRATAQKIATLANAEPADRSRIFWTSTVLSSLLALLAMAIFVPFAGLGLGLMDLPNAALREEVRDALPLLVAAVPFGIAQSLLRGALEGRSEFLKINVITSVGTIVTAVLPLLAALLIGPRLTNLLVASLVARALTLFLLLVSCIETVPLQRPRRASQNEVGQLLRFGGWTTITGMVSPLLAYLDRFVIGAMLGSAAVALYVVPFSVISQLAVLPAALATAMFPRLAAAPVEESTSLSRAAMLVLTCIVTPLTILMAAGIDPFFQAWLGPSNGRASAPAAYLLLIGFWANSLARVPFAKLQAEGKPNLIANTHVAEIIPYLALLYFAMLRFGIAGAALAWSVRCIADTIILLLLARTEVRMLRLLFTCGIVVVPAVLAAFFAGGSVGMRLLLGALSLLTAVLLLRNTPQVSRRLRELLRIETSRPGELP